MTKKIYSAPLTEEVPMLAQHCLMGSTQLLPDPAPRRRGGGETIE